MLTVVSSVTSPAFAISHQKLELRFSSANGAGLFTADVMFIYIFTKNGISVTHRDN